MIYLEAYKVLCVSSVSVCKLCIKCLRILLLTKDSWNVYETFMKWLWNNPYTLQICRKIVTLLVAAGAEATRRGSRARRLAAGSQEARGEQAITDICRPSAGGEFDSNDNFIISSFFLLGSREILFLAIAVKKKKQYVKLFKNYAFLNFTTSYI